MKDSVELVITAQGETRKYKISFPTVGEYYRIQCLKTELSRNNYGGLISAGTVDAVQALDMIDIEATLTVLAPQLIRDLKVDRFSKLGLLDYAMIKKAYIETVSPFMAEIYKALNPE